MLPLEPCQGGNYMDPLLRKSRFSCQAGQSPDRLAHPCSENKIYGILKTEKDAHTIGCSPHREFGAIPACVQIICKGDDVAM